LTGQHSISQFIFFIFLFAERARERGMPRAEGRRKERSSGSMMEDALMVATAFEEQRRRDWRGRERRCERSEKIDGVVRRIGSSTTMMANTTEEVAGLDAVWVPR
jgi:hypothetical protein